MPLSLQEMPLSCKISLGMITYTFERRKCLRSLLMRSLTFFFLLAKLFFLLWVCNNPASNRRLKIGDMNKYLPFASLEAHSRYLRT